MKAPSRRGRLSATTMLKNGRALAPPRESRMTTIACILGWVGATSVETRAVATRPATRWEACDYSLFILHERHPAEPRVRQPRHHGHLRPPRAEQHRHFRDGAAVGR